MKRKYRLVLILGLLAISFNETFSQCSICTKTASQLGEEPATALNSGIVYLMLTPLAIMAYIGVRWWKTERQIMKEEGTN